MNVFFIDLSIINRSEKQRNDKIINFNLMIETRIKTHHIFLLECAFLMI